MIQLNSMLEIIGLNLQQLNAVLLETQDESRVWSIVDVVSTGISTLVTAAATAAELGNIFPNASSTGKLAESIGNVASKLKECVAQWWLEAKAKAASRAEDLKNIATNMVEHVKSFGLMIAQLAASEAAWVAETAAKVASTAASWAQIAATTAWKVLCVAATAVTTAFGAAMTFLTSPIGLAVVA